jgi:succinate dehydrogenase / fumarate reductase membrane anchor subunit
MSVGRTVWLGNPPARRARPPAGSGRERFWWWFMRLSGLALVILALGHMFIMHVLVQLSGQEISWAFVTSRWGTPFWRIYDALLLVLALIHGVNGARVVITDLVPKGGIRAVLVGGLALLAFAWLVLGLMVVVFFNPDTAPPVGPFS